MSSMPFSFAGTTIMEEIRRVTGRYGLTAGGNLCHGGTNIRVYTVSTQINTFLKLVATHITNTYCVLAFSNDDRHGICARPYVKRKSYTVRLSLLNRKFYKDSVFNMSGTCPSQSNFAYNRFSNGKNTFLTFHRLGFKDTRF